MEFTTTNYGIKTTPKKEYEITSDPDKCPKEDKMNKERTISIRNVKRLDELVELDIVQKADLKHFEVKAIVSMLFTLNLLLSTESLRDIPGSLFWTHVPGIQHHAAPAYRRKVSG